MQRIPGASIEKICTGQAELSNDFDFDTFFEELEEEINKMHRAGFLHRDLKNGNVMVDNNNKPRIIDFGTATDIRQTGDIGMSAYEEVVDIYDPIKKGYVAKNGFFLEDLKESLPLLKESLKGIYWKKKGYRSLDQFGQPR